MAALLEKLGVPRNVRLFFQPYFEVLPDGSFTFLFGDQIEHFGSYFHRVPTSSVPWVAGDGPLLFYSHSAMEAIAFLSLHSQRFPEFSLLRFAAVGNYCRQLPRFPAQKHTLLFGNHLVGRLWDIRASVQLRGKQVHIACSETCFHFELPARVFEIPAKQLSLQSFERAARLRSGIRTCKPVHLYETFLQLLMQSI